MVIFNAHKVVIHYTFNDQRALERIKPMAGMRGRKKVMEKLFIKMTHLDSVQIKFFHVFLFLVSFFALHYSPDEHKISGFSIVKPIPYSNRMNRFTLAIHQRLKVRRKFNILIFFALAASSEPVNQYR